MQIIMDLLIMLGGVAVFMYGMKQMSKGMELSAGSGVRKLFKKINKNKWVDYAVGVGATAIVQSSSATSIMTVGLANSGIVNVRQGSGIILGAKVGTTLTAFIFALSGISKGGFNITAVFASIAFIGVIIIYTTSKDSLIKLSYFLIGFGMLFVGLEVMENAIGGADSILSIELTNVFKYGIMHNPIMLVILGILFTCIIQSSTAATGIFLIFLTTGVINNIDQSFFLIMGANIGTCSDGLMASIGTNANGKRIAIFHLLTSLIGALMFSIVLVFLKKPIVNIFESLFPDNPQWSLVTFNLIYNIIYTVIFLFFMEPVVALVSKIIKEKDEDKEQRYNIDDRLLTTPTMAVDHALKEVSVMAAMAHQNFDRAFEGLIQEDMSDSKLIASEEYKIDDITRALASFFIKISSKSTSGQYEKLIGGLHHVINDIERIGDYAILIAKETNSMKELKIKFLTETKTELNEIHSKITDMADLSYETFKTRKKNHLKQISEIHREINEQLITTRDVHIVRLSSNMYSVEISKSLYSVLFSLQRVADHIVNIAFSIVSDTGSKTEAFKNIEKARKKRI